MPSQPSRIRRATRLLRQIKRGSIHIPLSPLLAPPTAVGTPPPYLARPAPVSVEVEDERRARGGGGRHDLLELGLVDDFDDGVGKDAAAAAAARG